MSTQIDDDSAMTESCAECSRKTPHDVSIQLRTESRKAKNVEYSREPYRVSVCRICGVERSVRMNNA